MYKVYEFDGVMFHLIWKYAYWGCEDVLIGGWEDLVIWRYSEHVWFRGLPLRSLNLSDLKTGLYDYSIGGKTGKLVKE